MSYNSYASAARRSRRPAVYSSRNNRGRSTGNRRGGQYIDPRRFVNKPIAVAEQVAYVPQHTFNDFDLHDGLKRNITACGYTQPTAIQDNAIVPILEGRDLVGLANTGSGKTAAFVIPLIQRLLRMPQGTTVLIVAPTRELAQQIDGEFRNFAQGSGFTSVVCVGGVSIGGQIATLRRHPQVIIGTPGRLKDLCNRSVLALTRTGIIILDEADQMLDMGFIHDIQFLIEQIPAERQALCFSATMSPEVERLIYKLLRDPVSISVQTSQTSEHIEQDVVQADSKEHKLTLLSELLAKPDFEKVLIFGETKWGVQRLAESLTRQGFSAEAIHGNKSQAQRQRALQAFKKNNVNVLVATDVAARGLDIPNVSHVINFDQPKTYQDYIHRIGRTGRAGKTGKALTFIT